MVSRMVGQHDILQFLVLCDTCCDRKHDTITERHNSGLHVVFIIIAFGDSVRSFEQGRMKEFLKERQCHDLMRDTEAFAMQFGEREFFVIMVTAVVKRHSQRDALAKLI